MLTYEPQFGPLRLFEQVVRLSNGFTKSQPRNLPTKTQQISGDPVRMGPTGGVVEKIRPLAMNKPKSNFLETRFLEGFYDIQAFFPRNRMKVFHQVVICIREEAIVNLLLNVWRWLWYFSNSSGRRNQPFPETSIGLQEVFPPL